MCLRINIFCVNSMYCVNFSRVYIYIYIMFVLTFRPPSMRCFDRKRTKRVVAVLSSP